MGRVHIRMDMRPQRDKNCDLPGDVPGCNERQTVINSQIHINGKANKIQIWFIQFEA